MLDCVLICEWSGLDIYHHCGVAEVNIRLELAMDS
jgi:hypothetical protein